MLARRCPMCHRANAAAASCCSCGLDIDQHLARVHARLKEQLAGAWLTLIIMLVLDAAASTGAIYAAIEGFIVFSALGFTALILTTARAAQNVVTIRASLKRFADRYRTLPRAVVHRR